MPLLAATTSTRPNEPLLLSAGRGARLGRLLTYSSGGMTSSLRGSSPRPAPRGHLALLQNRPSILLSCPIMNPCQSAWSTANDEQRRFRTRTNRPRATPVAGQRGPAEPLFAPAGELPARRSGQDIERLARRVALRQRRPGAQG